MALTTVLIGTYTQNPTHGPEFTVSPSGAEGIYRAKFNPATGELTEYALAAEVSHILNKTPCRLISWATAYLPWPFIAVFPQEMCGPACVCWADLTP
jgi:hypothetical protein